MPHRACDSFLLSLVLAAVLWPQARLAVRVENDGGSEEPLFSALATQKVHDHHEASAAKLVLSKPASMLQNQEEICRNHEAAEKRRRSKFKRSRFSRRLGRAAKKRQLERKICCSLAQTKALKQDDVPRGMADNKHPWEMTMWDKIGLQGGWILLFAGGLLAILCFCQFSESITAKPKRAMEAEVEEVQLSPTMYTIYGLLWGEGKVGMLVSAGIIALSILNFFFYAWATEMEFPEQEDYKFLDLDLDAPMINRVLETLSLMIFLPMTVMRIMTIQCHPAWRDFGRSAPLRYAVSDVYIIAEEVALVVSISDLPRYLISGTHCHLNLFFLFFMRSFDMLERSGAGLGIKQLRLMLQDDGKLLLTASIFGIVVWIIMSGLYFTANRKNDQEFAVWEVATYNGEPWSKFESIPSLMWFVLINLLKEHPLADAFETFWQRLWVCVVCIFAMPMFAVPASILQSSLFAAEEKAAEEEALAGPVAGSGPEQYEEPEPMGRQEPPPSYLAGVVTAFLIFGSLFTYFYFTAQGTEHDTLFGVHVPATAEVWALIDFTLTALFAAEWGYRITSQGIHYAMTPLGIIDFLAWAPGLVHVLMQWGMQSTICKWWSAASVLRVLKLERYFHSWRDIIDIVMENRGVLGATFLLSMMLWMLFSVVVYATEVTNPDPDMRAEFGSVMRALWAQIINLHGEWPWADYTTYGKAAGTFIGLFSIMLFCVPISIFSDAFRSKIAEEAESFPEDFDRRPWQQRCLPSPDGLQLKVYDLFYSHLHYSPAAFKAGFLTLRFISFALVGLTTAVSVMGTLPNDHFGEWSNMVLDIYFWIDTIAFPYFLFEYVARIFATGGRHAISLIGLCDLLSLVGFGVSLHPEWRDIDFHPRYEHKDWWSLKDDVVILMRLMRLFSLESYLGALHVLKNVFYLYRWPLARAGYSLGSTWVIHATLLYMFEKQVVAEHGHEHDDSGVQEEEADGEEDEIPMSYRYRSILSALQYSIVHLFGDYPETEYYFESKVVHFFGIMGGIAIIATFCGVFSGCIINYLEEERRQEMKELTCRRAFVFMKCIRAFQRAYRRQKARRERGSNTTPPVILSGWKQMARNIAYEKTPQGQGIMYFFNAMLIVAIMNTMVASLPESSKCATFEHTCLGIELVCTAVFIVEYIIRVAAYPRQATEFFRLLDLACCFPGPVRLFFVLVYGRNGAPKLEAIMEALAMIRAARILEFRYFQREVALICRSFRDALPKLVVPGYLAVNVWIVTSALFMWLENFYKDEKTNVAESMPTVPDAMYWCCIFLTGEWANVDFTYAGSRLCIFYVLFGISMFSIPVGILVEAVQTNIMKATEEKQQMNMLMSMTAQGHGKSEAVTFTDVLRRASSAGRRATMRPRASVAARRPSMIPAQQRLSAGGGRASVDEQRQPARASRASLAARASISGRASVDLPGARASVSAGAAASGDVP